MDIKTCKYNEDYGDITVIFENGKIITLLCDDLEAELGTNMITSSRLEWLKENDLVSYTDMMLSGDMQEYLNQYLSGYCEERKSIQEQMEQYYDKSTAKQISNELIRYDT